MSDQPEPVKFAEVKTSVAFFNKLVQFLHGLPYATVRDMMEDIKKEFHIVPLMPAAKEENPEEKPNDDK
jgi:hypothetical protein